LFADEFDKAVGTGIHIPACNIELIKSSNNHPTLPTANQISLASVGLSRAYRESCLKSTHALSNDCRWYRCQSHVDTSCALDLRPPEVDLLLAQQDYAAAMPNCHQSARMWHQAPPLGGVKPRNCRRSDTFLNWCEFCQEANITGILWWLHTRSDDLSFFEAVVYHLQPKSLTPNCARVLSVSDGLLIEITCFESRSSIVIGVHRIWPALDQKVQWMKDAERSFQKDNFGCNLMLIQLLWGTAKTRILALW